MNYKKGEMDIEEQKKIYAGFIKFLFAIVAFSTFALIFWLCLTHKTRSTKDLLIIFFLASFLALRIASAFSLAFLQRAFQNVA